MEAYRGRTKSWKGGKERTRLFGESLRKGAGSWARGDTCQVWPHRFSCFRFSSLICSIFYWLFFLAFSCWLRVGVEDYMFVPTIYLVWLGLVWHCMGFSVRCLHFCLIPPSLVYHPSPYPSYIHLEIISARRARIRGSPVVSGNKMALHLPVPCMAWYKIWKSGLSFTEVVCRIYWDGIMKYMKEDEPNYDRVVELMLEVRDKICNVAPRSWKPEIVEASKRDIWKHLSLTSIGWELFKPRFRRSLWFPTAFLFVDKSSWVR